MPRHENKSTTLKIAAIVINFVVIAILTSCTAHALLSEPEFPGYYRPSTAINWNAIEDHAEELKRHCDVVYYNASEHKLVCDYYLEYEEDI